MVLGSYEFKERYTDALSRLKLKRPQTAKKYKGIIDRLYEEGFEDGKGKPIAKL